LTARAQESQKSLSFVIGHLLFQASFQNRQIYCTNADVSSRVQFSVLQAKDTLVSSSAHCVSLLNKDLLDFPSTGRLLVGFPGVLPSTTQGLLAAILLNQPVKITKLSCFYID
jgi:hypothetical protein